MDRQLCFVYDLIWLCQCNIYDIFTIFYYNMEKSLYCMFHTIASYLKGNYFYTIYIYTLEYVTWPHEAKTYVNSLLMEVFWIDHTSVWLMLSKIYSYDSCVWLKKSVLRIICGVLTKWLTLLRFVFRVLRNRAISFQKTCQTIENNCKWNP